MHFALLIAETTASSATLTESLGQCWQRVSHYVLCPLLWSTILSAASLWLLLPQGTLRGRTRGTVLALASLVLLGLYLPRFGSSWEQLSREALFWCFAALTAVSAVATISMRSPVYSALSFAMTLLGASGLLMIQGAQFLGVATVVVYAGAIVVTFLFVVMLAQPSGHAFYDRISWGALPLASASLVASLLVAGLAFALHKIEEPLVRLRDVVASLRDEPRGDRLIEPEDILAAHLEPARAANEPAILHLSLVDRPDGTTVAGVLLAEREIARSGLYDVDPERFQIRPRFFTQPPEIAKDPHVATLGGLLFSEHLASVEAAGTLLLAALVGAVAIVVHGRERSPPPGATDRTAATGGTTHA